MVGTDKTAILCAVFSFFASQATMPVQAASTSVGVSINFAVAPADLFSTRNIDPTNVRLCESLKARIDTEWAAKSSGPVITCSSQSSMPLIVTDTTGIDLIVRP